MLKSKMIKMTNGDIYLEDETIELTSDLADDYSIDVVGCMVKFDTTGNMLQDLAVNPDNAIGDDKGFDPSVQRIGVYDGGFRIQGKIVMVDGVMPEEPRLIAKRCRVISNGFTLDPELIFGDYEVE